MGMLCTQGACELNIICAWPITANTTPIRGRCIIQAAPRRIGSRTRLSPLTRAENRGRAQVGRIAAQRDVSRINGRTGGRPNQVAGSKSLGHRFRPLRTIGTGALVLHSFSCVVGRLTRNDRIRWRIRQLCRGWSLRKLRTAAIIRISYRRIGREI